METIEIYKLILKLVDFSVAAARLAPEVKAEYDATRAKVEQIISERRDPTSQEFVELDQDINALHNKLHGIETPKV